MIGKCHAGDFHLVVKRSVLTTYATATQIRQMSISLYSAGRVYFPEKYSFAGWVDLGHLGACQINEKNSPLLEGDSDT